jgi:nitric oxide reductase activation protein
MAANRSDDIAQQKNTVLADSNNTQGSNANSTQQQQQQQQQQVNSNNPRNSMMLPPTNPNLRVLSTGTAMNSHDVLAQVSILNSLCSDCFRVFYFGFYVCCDMSITIVGHH